MGVSSIPFDDRRLFSTFSGLVVSARFARAGLAIADSTSWPYSGEFGGLGANILFQCCSSHAPRTIRMASGSCPQP